MRNTYFQFKQFRIAQEASAMKVTTDACIQGAWTPVCPQVTKVLDIGTGTGLLSLMLAQRADHINIDAIELDNEAVNQAKENISVAPWQNRINLIHGDARIFPFGNQYDLIICNPPFFKDSFLSNTVSRNRARHDVSLSQNDLFEILNRNLSSGGYASVLFPLTEYIRWKALLQQKGWVEMIKLSISHTQEAEVKRVVSICCRKSSSASEEHTLAIKNGDQYTTAFTDLLAPFYLYL